MPTYEYRCKECGWTFERFQSMRDKPLEKCPKCDGSVQRLISGGGGVIFKGPRSHATEYGAGTVPACGRDRPCCGRETPCDQRPCDS